MLNTLLIEISEKGGLFGKVIKNLLDSPSYTEEKGLTILTELYHQTKDAPVKLINIYGRPLISKIEDHLFPKSIQIIVTKKTKVNTIQRRIIGEYSKGSLGDYWLLIEEYNRLDPSWIPKKIEKWRRLTYNEQFSNYMLLNFNELQCEYCGKENLIIFKWNEKHDIKIICTVDHFYPKKDYPLLKEEPSNLFICCHKCNNKKAKKIYTENTLKFRYNDSIRSKFKFDESKLTKPWI